MTKPVLLSRQWWFSFHSILGIFTGKNSSFVLSLPMWGGFMGIFPYLHVALLPEEQLSHMLSIVLSRKVERGSDLKVLSYICLSFLAVASTWFLRRGPRINLNLTLRVSRLHPRRLFQLDFDPLVVFCLWSPPCLSFDPSPLFESDPRGASRMSLICVDGKIGTAELLLVIFLSFLGQLFFLSAEGS